MDYDSSSKFISSLAKFLQSLCNGYVEFDTGVQVIGHLYLSVDTGKTIDYILNEKVCKTDENSVTFISNSFHAQPAEKPKPASNRSAKENDKTDLKIEDSDNCINSQGEPRSTNVGTLPAVRSLNQNSPHSHGVKRPHSPLQKSLPKSGRTSPRHKKGRTESQDQSTSQFSNPASENSISSAPSPAADANTLVAHGPDIPHGLNESYQQSFFHPDEENSLADDSEERDIKPNIDTDVTFIKEEYAPSSSCSQSGSQSRDDSTYPYQSNPVFPGNYAGQGGFGVSQRANFNSSGSHMFSPSQASSKAEDNSGDPSDLCKRKFGSKSFHPTKGIHHMAHSKGFVCHFCDKSFNGKQDLEGHINAQHLNCKPYQCQICSKGFAYEKTLKCHQRTSHFR